MAAQAAAVGVEPRPGRDHLHGSGRRRWGASALPSLQEPGPRHSRPPRDWCRLPNRSGSVPARARSPCNPRSAPLSSSPESSARLRTDPELRGRCEEEEQEGAGHVTRAPAGDVTTGSSQLRALPASVEYINHLAPPAGPGVSPPWGSELPLSPVVTRVTLSRGKGSFTV